MGVVRRRVEVPHPEEPQATNQELPQNHSETESIASEPAPLPTNIRRRNRGHGNFFFADRSSLGIHAGRRKLHRHANTKMLEVLLEDDESEDGLLESYKDPFERLMELTDEPLEFLNEFTLRLEEESSVEPSELRDKGDLSPFYKISNKIRRTIKARKNLPISLLKNIEDDVLTFFKLAPSGVFFFAPVKSFDRLMFHAVAQYHSLKSESLIQDGKICVEVTNEDESWVPVEVSLSEYVSRNFECS